LAEQAAQGCNVDGIVDEPSASDLLFVAAHHVENPHRRRAGAVDPQPFGAEPILAELLGRCFEQRLVQPEIARALLAIFPGALGEGDGGVGGASQGDGRGEDRCEQRPVRQDCHERRRSRRRVHERRHSMQPVKEPLPLAVVADETG